MLLDTTSAGHVLEILNPELKAEIDHAFQLGTEKTLLKHFFKDLYQYMLNIDPSTYPLIGLVFEANIPEDVLNWWKPKRVRIYSFDNTIDQNNPLQDSIRYDDYFILSTWYEEAHDYLDVHDNTNWIDIGFAVNIDDYYNEHPGGDETVESSSQKVSIDGWEWQSGGFTNFDGPVIDSTTGIIDPWLFDAPFGCDLCRVDLTEILDIRVMYKMVSSYDYSSPMLGVDATCLISTDGGPFVYQPITSSEIGQGWYSTLLPPAVFENHTIIISFDSTGCLQCDFVYIDGYLRA